MWYLCPRYWLEIMSSALETYNQRALILLAKWKSNWLFLFWRCCVSVVNYVRILAYDSAYLNHWIGQLTTMHLLQYWDNVWGTPGKQFVHIKPHPLPLLRLTHNTNSHNLLSHMVHLHALTTSTLIDPEWPLHHAPVQRLRTVLNTLSGSWLSTCDLSLRNLKGVMICLAYVCVWGDMYSVVKTVCTGKDMNWHI